MLPDELLEPVGVLRLAGVAHHEVVVAAVVDVVVDRNEVDVLEANVDADAGLAKPNKVRHLLRVGDVVGRL